MRQIAISMVYRCTCPFAAFYHSNKGEEFAGERPGFTRYFRLVFDVMVLTSACNIPRDKILRSVRMESSLHSLRGVTVV
jgi:hypothetical protein